MFKQKIRTVGSDGKPVGRKIVIPAVVAVVAVILLAASITIVPTGHTGVVVTLGKVGGNVLTEGFHLKAPFVQKYWDSVE